MRTLLNILWLFLAGLWLALAPFGKQIVTAKDAAAANAPVAASFDS